MLLLSSSLVDIPVMSLQTGGEIARTTGYIIDPRDLAIVALYVDGPLVEERPAILHTDDIREAGELGFIIDDSTKLMSLDGLVRLQQILDFHFDVMSCTIHLKSGKKLGRVHDFTYDPASYTVQQIYIQESLLRRLTTTSNIINRSQIISITNQRIIVETPTLADAIPEQSESAPAFVNPFRQPQPQPDQTDID